MEVGDTDKEKEGEIDMAGERNLVKEGRGLICQLAKIILGEKEKKKLAVAVCGEIESINDRIGEVFEEIAEENVRMKARYEEKSRCVEGLLRAIAEGERNKAGGFGKQKEGCEKDGTLEGVGSGVQKESPVVKMKGYRLVAGEKGEVKRGEKKAEGGKEGGIGSNVQKVTGGAVSKGWAP